MNMADCILCRLEAKYGVLSDRRIKKLIRHAVSKSRKIRKQYLMMSHLAGSPPSMVIELTGGMNGLETAIPEFVLSLSQGPIVYYPADFLLCRKCGHDIVRYDNLINNTSILSHRQRNESIHGGSQVLIQLFKNPHGNYFEVITSTTADIHKVDKAYSQDSWFPGFTWTIAVCPRCGQHLGWVFEGIEGFLEVDTKRKSFVGLILDKLLHQNYADSLLIIPKSYKS